MTNLRAVLMTTAFVALAAFSASAQQPAPMQGHQGMPGMSMPGMSMPSTSMPGNASPSTKAYQAANDRMMKDMGANMTGDADRDFVGGMIPHHSGAIDMAKIELEYGKDPMLRELAKGIITAQEKEIAEMTAWQKVHPAKP